MSPFYHYECSQCAEKGHNLTNALKLQIGLKIGDRFIHVWERSQLSHVGQCPEAFLQRCLSMLHCVPGLPAVPEQHGAALLLAATPPFLLCRAGLAPAVPGAAAPVLHSQVNPCCTPSWGLGCKNVCIYYGLHLLTSWAGCSPVYR